MNLSIEQQKQYGLHVKPANRHSQENRPLFDQRGYCHGYIVKIELFGARAGEDGKTYGSSYRWRFECPGTLKTFGRMYWTWTRQRLPRPGETVSAFMELCIRLKLTRETGRMLLDTEVDLSKAEGLAIVYTLLRKDGIYHIDPDSISLEAGYPAQLELWGQNK